MTELSLEKESIVKTLLTSTPLNLSTKTVSSSASLTASRTVNVSTQYTVSSQHSRSRHTEDPVSKMHNYYNQFAGLIEKDPGIIAMDHCYARPLNWTPESAFFQPTKTLFMPPLAANKRKSTNPLAPLQDCEDIIDVESVPLQPPELYDKPKALHMMDECERHATFARVNQGNEDWEDTISRLNWTPVQNRLFNGMVNILNSDRLARLAHSDTYHEPILRRIVIEKSVKRVRHLFATVSWDTRLTQWLHQLLIDNLSTPYLAAYLDILQTLKTKLPTFVDKIMYGPHTASRIGVTSNESLFHLLKRVWDPYASHLSQNRPRKLPGNPVIIIAPSAPSTSNTVQFKRQHKWTNLLSSLATVVVVHTNIGNTANRLTMMNCADQMLAATRAKLQEVKVDYPGRPIILAGFNAGSALALQVAQVEHVVCVVCLGFSLLTAEGKRGDPDDSVLELQCPVLFVIGQCSYTSLQEDMEDLRERMRVENGLIVVGSADDYLRISKKKKRAEGITQNAVDRIIVENVGEFISGLLLSPYPPQMRQSPTHVPPEAAFIKRSKVERKRHNSNGSSIESEPPSPTPKITRPVGRPPGSKSKTKLESKWAAQGIPSPDSPPPPILTPICTDIPPSPSLLPPTLQPSEISPVDKIPKILPSCDLSRSTPDKLSLITTVDSLPKSNNQQVKTSSSSAAKMQAMSMNRSVLTSGGTLSTLLQGGCRPSASLPQTPKQASSVKVLENLTLNTNSTAKLISSTTGRSIDLSKITVLNSVNATKPPSSAVGNVVLMPDGKIKSIGSSGKGSSNVPMLFSTSNKTRMPGMPQTPSGAAHRVARYITSKKQLIGRKPPHPTQKPVIVPSYSSNLPPPTNLTSQDIMDLPIIFADDNQMLTDNSKLQQSDIVPVSEIIPSAPAPKLSLSNPVGKFVFINKQVPLQSLAVSSASSTPTLKRPTLSVPVRTNTNPVKYTKIIISRGSTTETKTAAASALSKISNLSPEISIRKIEPSQISSMPMVEDVENAIVSTTIKKPDYHISGAKNVMKKEQESNENVEKKTNTVNTELGKRTAAEAELTASHSSDSDHTPSKNAKIITNS